jgi:hypothetical protein
MFQILRRVGIAFGSFVAATLCVGLVGAGVGSALTLVGASAPPIPMGGFATAAITFILGGLIYQDIVRRDRPPA